MSAGSGGVTLLHELMGLMRRSLTQQAPIRGALYQARACGQGRLNPALFIFHHLLEIVLPLAP